ncbi:chromosome partitioning protein ParA [Candidatus Phytoplasma tritici]|uniref:chromosome partitioning protein ParA n=1 Tax=Candidatus Phytoplasma tritici TaxID=321961 RepID=UPI001F11EECD|nr:chromosome partitioning protein ParA [Candidatus Phytoplasma tritici]
MVGIFLVFYLKNASGKYIEENAELRHEINKLKEQIKDEQKAHETTKSTLKTKSEKLTQKTEKLKKIDLIIQDQKLSYSAAIQPLKYRIKEDVRQRVKSAKENVNKVTSWFKKWF